jgi:small GTP-binding protein
LAIVDNQPGVTIDCQEDQGQLENMEFTVIDTPGAENIDTILAQTREAIKSADIALVVTDYKVGVTQWDKRIAKFVLEKKIPAIHILNKVDEVIYEEEQEEIFERVRIGIDHV